MINADAELNRLRSQLNNSNWLPQEIDEIVDEASSDINEAILDIVSSAVADITDYAIELGAEEFLEDLDVVDVGGGFMITTRSGKTDYSFPERQMLPDLLKNAEISKEGKRYKVIPIGTSNRSPGRDIFSSMQQVQAAQQEARARIIQNNLDKRSQRAQAMASHFRSIISDKLQQLHQQRQLRREKTANVNPVKFVTASEKQDPTTNWVLPAKELDITGALMDMNKRIEEQVYEAVTSIISVYEAEFV